MKIAAIWGKVMQRFGLLIVLVLVYVLSQVALNRPATVQWVTLDEPRGYRMAVGPGQSAAVFDPLAGIDAARPDARLTANEVCELLGPIDADGSVEVVYFADFFCPNCRELDRLLARLAVAGAITVDRREWPILGPASEFAARGYLAAQAQGAGEEFLARLSRAQFVPNESYLRSLAASIDLDADRLIVDMYGDTVDETLSINRDLARFFGLYATPSMVIGNSIVAGTLEQDMLEQIVEESGGQNCPPNG